MKHSLQLKLSQNLTMTPQLQQAIRLLQLSTFELQTEVQQALEENPMLEQDDEAYQNTIEDKSSGENPPDQQQNNPEASNETITAQDDQHLDMENNQSLPDELSVDASWEDTYDISLPANTNNNTDNSGNDFLENQSIAGNTLQEHLIWQLQNSPVSDTDMIIATALIDAIDDDGYLTESVEEIYQSLQGELDIEADEVEAVLHRIQHFDPVGTGARNLSECLLLQLDQFDEHTECLSEARIIIKQYLNLLGSHDYARLQKKLRCNEQHLHELITFIQTLNPKPGDAISANKAQYIIPDIYVRKINGVWKVSLNPEATPKLKINQLYESHLKQAGRGKDTTYLRNSLQEARWFLKSLQSRSDTLQRVGEAIVKRQRLFLEYGDEGMKPMVLRDIAEELEMHESTISRVTTNKYMHTPSGVYEFKFFFSSHVSTVDGGECSATAIRSMVKKLIENENPKKPMSDNKISSFLVKEGINVARRTVAKYRESMMIPPSNERKRLA